MTREAVLEVLRGIADPGRQGDIVASGTVRALNVEAGTVRFVLEIAPGRAEAYEAVRQMAEDKVRALACGDAGSVVLTGHRTQPAPPELKSGHCHGHAPAPKGP